MSIIVCGNSDPTAAHHLLYSDKLAHIQVVINCRYSVAQKCTSEDTLTHNLGSLYFDDVMSYNSLTTKDDPHSLSQGNRLNR